MKDKHNRFEELNLKEHTLYEIKVSWGKSNPIHQAFLFTGFKTGSYCEVYTNNYDEPENMSRAYSIEIVRELAEIKTFG